MNADVKPSKLTRHLIPQRAAVAIFNPSTSTSTDLTSAMNASETLYIGAMGAPGLFNDGYDLSKRGRQQ